MIFDLRKFTISSHWYVHDIGYNKADPHGDASNWNQNKYSFQTPLIPALKDPKRYSRHLKTLPWACAGTS